ncbi:hypothetical protein [Catenulispora rubra]|uniref:hypothetical protein n=1 Tax=Catenulispora rubra TaxID=280293 RepID=UPI001891F914|nr:hypothetical protein [Catenulispora rubra]
MHDPTFELTPTPELKTELKTEIEPEIEPKTELDPQPTARTARRRRRTALCA